MKNPLETIDDLFKISEDVRVELGDKMAEVLDTELCLGMSRYEIRHGTLSDGHEAVNDTIRFFRAPREIFQRAATVRSYKYRAQRYQADILDAQEELEKAEKPSQKMRAQSKLDEAKDRLFCCLVECRDSMRQLDEFCKIYEELRPQVRSKYPQGIEQAMPDIWKAIAEYKIKKRKAGYQEHLTHVPLDPIEKARLGLKYGQKEMTLFLEETEKDTLNVLAGGDIGKLIEILDEQKKLRLNGHTGETTNGSKTNLS